MKSREQRKIEERVLLYQVFCEKATTDNERLLGIRNAQFVEKTLELYRINSLMGLGSRKAGKMAWYDTLLTMMDVEIAERYELGLIPKTVVQISEIESATFQFTFKIVKVKTKAVMAGKKAIRYTNSVSVLADTIDEARNELQRRLKKLGDTMLEEVKFTKRLYSIRTMEGVYHSIDTIEIIQ